MQINQHASVIQNMGNVNGFHIGETISTEEQQVSTTSTEVKAEKTLNLTYDWGHADEYSDAWLWIAVMENPGMPEPHCYGASIGFDGERAETLIGRMKGKTGAAAKEEIFKIWNEN
ncbi:hypothetical protein NIES4071_103620 (plasmid) [Calothrix sp. NIES-4071]|nr:hypothetical protein NIES4071_103620 [Calothrix sp. NIES-4071]BAZ64349.1 hypothetical protein NIES4105_100820 [Calothrix sp. NIES-4105]